MSFGLAFLPFVLTMIFDGQSYSWKPMSWAFVLALGALPSVGQCAEEPVSFRNDVMAVLSRGGCNAGACHGNQNGKGGFKLSLRGENPEFDFDSLTRDAQGRRTNAQLPRASLLLLKPTGQMAHEGGRRFAADSAEARILERWIAGGLQRDPPSAAVLERLVVTPAEQILTAPADSVALGIEAIFSDGSKRDVTRLAVFELTDDIAAVSRDGIVRREKFGQTAILVRYLDRQATVRLAFVPARPDFVWKAPHEANFIDEHVFARLKTLRMRPSETCSDPVFLRRAYLDAIGTLPTPEETRRFLADTRLDKRARLVDDVLARTEFAEFWALKWADLLRVEEKTLDRKGVQVFHDWVRRSLAEAKPLNEMARELIAARGSTYSQPAANYYRALRDPQVRAEATAQVFLGLRLQCAKCHNHPFDRWKQDDYHSFAAFFARVQYRIVDNQRKDRLDSHEFIGDQIVWQARTGEVKHPRTAEPCRPKLLGGAAADADGDRLQALADWVADPNNSFFARAQANRVWHHLMGRGIVEPNDDFRASNPPSNSALLDALAADLVRHRFDLRQLVRTIMLSNTYQLSARPNETNTDDEANFSHAAIRPLQAEQLLDALTHVTGVPAEFAEQRAGIRAVALPGVKADRRRDGVPLAGDRFLALFGKPVRSLSCECERQGDTTVGKALELLNGETVNRMLASENNRIGQLVAAGTAKDAMVEELYLAALCRLPSPDERKAATGLIDRARTRRQGLEDVLWCLVNCKEFQVRQ